MSPLIDVRNLTKTYLLGDVVVNTLQGVTLAIERGTFWAVLTGPHQANICSTELR